MNVMKPWLALALAICLALPLAACGAGGGSGAGQPSATPAPSPSASPSPSAAPDGSNLALALTAGPSSLDPAVSTSPQSELILAHLFEGLMGWEDSGKAAGEGVNAAQLVPAAAQSYDRAENADGTVTYTFHLRPDGKWSDGKPVTAQDFVFGWQRACDGQGAYSELLTCVVNGQAVRNRQTPRTDLAVQALDEATFAVTVHDVAWFLELCAMPLTAPVREDTVEAKTSQWSYEPESCLTNGPYKLKSWDDQSALVLEKNDQYRQKVTGPDTLTFYFESDATSTANAFSQGFLQAAVGTPAKDAAYTPALVSYYVCFQTQTAPFDDPLVRKAFSLAADRAAAVKANPGQVPAGALVPQGVWDENGVAGKGFRAQGGDYVDSTEAAYEKNCDQARQLLAQAGYPEGRGLGEVEYLYPANPVHKAVAQALQAGWEKALGVTVKLREEDWSTFLGDCSRGEFTLAQGRWAADYNDPAAFLELWTTEGDANDGRYSSDRYDDLLARSGKTGLAPAERMRILHQAEKLLIDQDCALAPVYFETRPYLLAKGLKGVYCTGTGSFFFDHCTLN